MTQPATTPDIPMARGGIVTDAVLDKIIGLTGDMERGELSHEGGTLILQNLPALLCELRDRRAMGALIHQVTDPSNVIRLADRN